MFYVCATLYFMVLGTLFLRQRTQNFNRISSYNKRTKKVSIGKKIAQSNSAQAIIWHPQFAENKNGIVCIGHSFVETFNSHGILEDVFATPLKVIIAHDEYGVLDNSDVNEIVTAEDTEQLVVQYANGCPTGYYAL